MIAWYRTVVVWLLLAEFARADSQIPAAEVLYPPTPQRLAAVHAAAKQNGWLAQVPGLQAGAFAAYESDKLHAAEAWLNVCRWARIFGRNESDFVGDWIAAVNTARVGHRNMSAPAVAKAVPLGTEVSSELQAWLLGHRAFTAEFFALLSPVDYLPRVVAILNELHQREPARFEASSSLALAIAVVHDVPPPPFWPHNQVSAEALPRRLASPLEAFTWWTRQEQSGRLHHRVSRLGAAELKFVVDATAGFDELEWAQRIFAHPPGELPRAYSMVRYSTDRLAGDTFLWPGRTYQLADILERGGICADQAYFATQVGKARGVPTLLFYGAGNDGRHAWFGFLDGNRKWQLEAGRYADQRFVTGAARDPQTWRLLTDHELKFLTEGFRELPAFRQSQVHASFAAEALAQGRFGFAAAAARKAVNFERRNEAAWEILLGAARREGKAARTIENVLREAALAFQRYPDLEASYVNRLADSLRARGETSAADNEVRRIALKNQGVRGDLSVQQARDIVARAINSQPVADQIRSFNSVLDTYGRGAGIAFFDEIVVPFAEHLVRLNQPAEALRALERARRTLRVDPRSQLAFEFDRFTAMVKAPKQR